MPYRSFLELALRGDRPGVRAFVDTLRQAGHAPDRLALDVVGPALVEVGDRWMRNELSVADEHLVSSIAERVLTDAMHGLPAAHPDAPLVLLAAVGSEAHRIGQQVLETLFLQAGFRVHPLGAQLPVPDLIAMTERLAPAVVGISVTMSYHVAEAREAVQALRQTAASPLVLLGGGLLEAYPHLGEGCEAHWVGFDAAAAVRFVRETIPLPAIP